MMKEKILIVDDEPEITSFLDKLLSQEGFEIKQANSGLKAMEIFNFEPVDLIITDIRMPGMDGVELIHKIKKSNKDQEIIVLTGFATIDNAVQILRDGGVYDYLTKPLKDIDAFIRTVNNAISQRKLKTEKKEMVKLLKKSKKRCQQEAARSDKLESLGILAGGIAHDFNNLMHVIMGNIAMVRRDANLDNNTAKLLKTAEKACILSTQLTSRMLTFSKGGKPVKQLTCITGLLKEAVAFVSEEFNVKSIVHVSDDIQNVYIDKNQIKQVIQNIVKNACTAMTNNGQLNVYCKNSDIMGKNHPILNENKYLQIVIKDQGCGISEKNIGKIFDPYFSTKNLGFDKGQGLGLAVCHSIIEKHDGKIIVDSEIDKGTTIIIYLPASNQKVTAPKQVFGKEKILVMDDEEMIRSYFHTALDRMGYDCKTCVDGSEAIEIYKDSMESDNPFGAIILDLSNQSGMGGKEAMEKLLELDPEAKGIVCTGYSNDPVVEDFKTFGFRDILLKPCDITQINKTLCQVIAN